MSQCILICFYKIYVAKLSIKNGGGILERDNNLKKGTGAGVSQLLQREHMIGWSSEQLRGYGRKNNDLIECMSWAKYNNTEFIGLVHLLEKLELQGKGFKFNMWTRESH